MKTSSMIKKLQKIVAKHTTDTGFGESQKDTIGTQLRIVLETLSTLSEYASKRGLTEKKLALASNAETYVSQSLSKIASDEYAEKFLKKQKSFISKIVEKTTELCETIKKDISLDAEFDIQTAKSLLGRMEKIPEEEKKDYEYLESAAKSGTNTFATYHIESDDFKLVAHMRNAGDICAKISNISTIAEYQDQLTAIQKQATDLYDSISLTIINHYDTLQKIDAELNQDHPLIRQTPVKEAKSYTPKEL